MQNYRLTIAYDGTRYKGWQRLQNTEQTIQGKIESVLSKLTNEPIKIIGSGRTDAGVHAREQIANFHTHATLTPDEIISYCLEYLPQDIVVLDVCYANDRFHARYNAASKRYIYQLLNGNIGDPFGRKYHFHIKEPLDISAMRKATSYFEGEHDFQSFTSMKSKKKSTIRTITKLELVEKGAQIHIVFEGNGFLHHMVRIIVGTLLEIGKGKIKPEDIPALLAKQKREFAGPTAPAQGLFLDEVIY